METDRGNHAGIGGGEACRRPDNTAPGALSLPRGWGGGVGGEDLAVFPAARWTQLTQWNTETRERLTDVILNTVTEAVPGPTAMIYFLLIS